MSAGQQPQRILLVAENASDKMGGEAILPCHYFLQFTQRNIDTHLVVHERCRTDLERLFPQQQSCIHYIQDTTLQKLLHALSRPAPQHLRDAIFGIAISLITQRRQRTITRSLVTHGSIIHQPIPVAPRSPSLLYNMGAPVVIGPMNGNMAYPPSFRKAEARWVRSILATARSFSNGLHHLFPGKRKAAALLVANTRTRDALPTAQQSNILLLPENGVDLSLWNPRETLITEPHFLFVGRLVDWKALDLALHALALTPDATLDVIGDGPMRTTWTALTHNLNISDRVQFHGWLTQSQVSSMAARSMALLLPSLYECGGAVVLESLACATPVIATAWGGPQDYIDCTCGFLVPPDSPEAIISGFAEAMTACMQDPMRAHTMGAAGRKRVEKQYQWPNKAQQILNIFDKVSSH